MAKTPEYTKKAIQNYNNKFDRVAVNLPKGTKDKIKELTGKSCNAYISELVIKDLENLENNDWHTNDKGRKEPNFIISVFLFCGKEKRKWMN